MAGNGGAFPGLMRLTPITSIHRTPNNPKNNYHEENGMDSEQLIELMEQIESKGLSWDSVQEETKVSHDILKLYANSGPVPVTIINKLKKVLEASA
jgi:hypothetical protein